MTNERIDEILGTEPELVPSSGFAASVMERVREEAAAPPPIPFPWKRAVPGMVVAAGVFGWERSGAGAFCRPRPGPDKTHTGACRCKRRDGPAAGAGQLGGRGPGGLADHVGSLDGGSRADRTAANGHYSIEYTA